MNDYSWFYILNKSPLTPPYQVFAPVWTILYILIALSFYFYIKSGFQKEKAIPISVFILQLTLSFLYTPTLFMLHDTKGAFIINLLLVILIFLNMILFYKKSKMATMLLIPYFMWTTFALYLSYEIVRLN